jgi:lysozyme
LAWQRLGKFTENSSVNNQRKLNMKVSERGLAEIAGHEGIVLSRYKDSVGVWTIGIGHTVNAGQPDPSKVARELSLREVMEIFARDVQKFERRVNKAFSKPLTQAQFDAAVSFDFNTGGIHRASWVKKFNAGDIKGARKSFMAWRKPKEIIPRRQAERDLFFDGKYSGNGKVNTYKATSTGKVMWSSGQRVTLPSLSSGNLARPNNDNKSKQKKKANKAGPLVVGGGLVVGALYNWWDNVTAFFAGWF